MDKDLAGKLLAIDVIDVLRVVFPIHKSLLWKMKGMDVIGGATVEEIDKYVKEKTFIDSLTVHRLFSQVEQTIDGTLEGFRSPNSARVVTIRVVDNSSIDVESVDLDLINQVSLTYQNVHRYQNVL